MHEINFPIVLFDTGPRLAMNWGRFPRVAQPLLPLPMTTRLLACLGLIAAAALAHPDDITLPVRKVAAALPAAPLGEGAWRFEIETGWAKIPEGTALGPTHGGIVVDKAGLI